MREKQSNEDTEGQAYLACLIHRKKYGPPGEGGPLQNCSSGQKSSVVFPATLTCLVSAGLSGCQEVTVYLPSGRLRIV